MKKIVIILCTILLILVASLGIRYFSTKKYITEAEAKQIATEDVSNKNGNYIFNSIEFSEINNNHIYTLNFYDNINLYTYKIDAKSKKIISSKKESLTNNKTYMKEEDILNIVFNHSNLNKTECNLLSNNVILEEGTPIYTTIFFYKNIRYEYKTNAYTGAIISVVKLNENAAE